MAGFIQFQFRRGTAAEWTSANPILADGELGVETDTKLHKIGNGITRWTDLDYGGLNEPAFTGALQAMQKAQAWAESGEEVISGGRSAKFWAEKSEQYAQLLVDGISAHNVPLRDLGHFPTATTNVEDALILLRQQQGYTHVQSAASSTWTINHNLGRYPSVTIVDSAGSAVLGSVAYLSTNLIEVTFTSQFVGKAFLN